MRYSMLPEENKTQDFIDLFGGYNHNIRIQDNEFYDMQNLSSDNYPTLSPRKKRGVPWVRPKDSSKFNGIMYKGDLYTVLASGNILYLYKNDGNRILLNTTDIPDEVERQLIMMGAYIIILPDKQYFNTANNTDCGRIQSTFISSDGDLITVMPCDIDGSTYDINGVSDTMPEDVWDGFVWLDTNEEPATLKKYTVTNSTWTPIATSYVRVTCKGIGKNFSSGDGVNISGFTNSDTEKLNGSTIIQTVIDEDNIVITGLLDTLKSNYTMSVKSNLKNSRSITLYCDSSINEGELAEKKLIVGNKTIVCETNTEVEESIENVIKTDDETIWLTDKCATLEVEQDAVDAYKVWVKYDSENPPLASRLEDVYVAFETADNTVEVKALGSIASGYNNAYLELYEPITVKAGVTVYPVVKVTSDSLYVTSVISSEAISAKRGDGACVALESAWNQSDQITLSRTMPTLDYVIESNNRLWGCRYGLDDSGNFVNQIYASALGDFKNWSVFAGTSADSYFATVGTSGEFTGAVNYMGYPVFFKDDCIHTVYGAYPAQYQINTTMARGVQKGCHKSLAVANEVLYYKSRDGIMSYTGSLPNCISYKLGKEKYTNAVCVAYQNKLYVSMRCVENKLTIDSETVGDCMLTFNPSKDNAENNNCISIQPNVASVLEVSSNKVQGLKVTNVTETSVTIAWNSVDGATKYWIYRNGNAYTSTTETSYTFENLTTGTSYTVAVVASFEDGSMYDYSSADKLEIKAEIIEEPNVLKAGYYLVGKLKGENKWNEESLTQDRMLTEIDDGSGDYYLEWSFKAGDEVCVVYFDGVNFTKWYPDASLLFVYDTEYGTWYKENGISALQMIATEDDVIYLSKENELESLFATGEENEENVVWCAETGFIGLDQINKKYISRMNIRLWLDSLSTVRFLIKYDSESNWKTIRSINGRGKLISVYIPIIPRRSDHFKLRIEGSGNVKIYSISKTIDEGSDL